MIERGYVDERRQLERIILDEANRKLRGPLKIIPYLVSKGYSSSEIREVISELVESGEIDFKSNARELLMKKMPDGADEDEVRKILYKNGFKI
jgi:SOS response regulatory protein OraA/RecX